MELGRQTRGSGASGSFREDRAGAPPALRSIQWSLHRGTSLTSRTGGQLGTEHNGHTHAHAGKYLLMPRWERGITTRYNGSGGRGQRVRIQTSCVSCCCVVVWPSIMFSWACLAVCLLPRKTAEIGNVLVSMVPGADRETHKGPGAWASGGRAHMIWYDKTGLNWP